MSPRTSTHHTPSFILAAAGAIAVLAFAPAARADGALAPGTHPMFFDVNIGPTLFMGASGSGGSVKCSTGCPGGKIGFEFGYHFSGDSSGPALGANFEVSFGDRSTSTMLVGVEPGVKFWWDIQPDSDTAFYLTPSAKLGYAALRAPDFPDAGGSNAFNIQLGFELKLIINDRGLIFFRPVTVDMWGGEVSLGSASAGGFMAFWDIMFGGGATLNMSLVRAVGSLAVSTLLAVHCMPYRQPQARAIAQPTTPATPASPEREPLPEAREPGDEPEDGPFESPDVVAHGTCHASCIHYLGCKGIDVQAGYVPCSARCEQMSLTPQALASYEQTDCAVAIQLAERGGMQGGSPKPAGLDCGGCAWDGQSCIWLSQSNWGTAGPYSGAWTSCDARCCPGH
jgi:hypothetical protein